MNITIRREREEDYRAVEELMKKAFWNVSEPGCFEHYLAHTLRKHADFIPELDYVLEADGKIAAAVMYAKCKLVDESGNERDVLTFGPVGVLPELQRRGLGKKLLNYSFDRALELGYDSIVIFGNPENYYSLGFKNGKRFGIGLGGDCYPVALLAKELKEGAFGGVKWAYRESPAYEVNPAEAEEFDKDFEQMEKAYQPSQELFWIYCRSIVNR